jgi:hypothetical protein
MITTDDFRMLVQQFKTYTSSLMIPDQYMQDHIDLKMRHTFDVIGNIRIIAKDSGLPETDIQLAKTIALVHDIGRFRQFLTYGTFDDSLSVNHAELGIRVLDEINFFQILGGKIDLGLIKQSVLNHNIPLIIHTPDQRVMLFSKLLRDADKVDIWRLMTIKDVVFKILNHDQPDHYTVPEGILNSFLKGVAVPSYLAEALNDYRLLRLSWIYDMNFPSTFRLLIRKNYASVILSRIPPSENLNEIAGIIQAYMHRQAIG